ncbi:hypothetical protein BH739_16320 [Enterococcus casseliflavus]|nr:hypothetical protein BH739_16320 [Enterococcus casseliflavus]
MKVIVFEGLDKSGKATQIQHFATLLKEQGKKVVTSEFHRYDTPTGKLIQDWLYHRWDVDQKTIELIMLADKQAQQRWFNELEAEGVDFLLLDRYLDSQLVYGAYHDYLTMTTENKDHYLNETDFVIPIIQLVSNWSSVEKIGCSQKAKKVRKQQGSF